MALSLRGYIDIESSTEIPVIEPETWIPDDLFQAALAASEHDSDREDPYVPQPKRFMQTERQKKWHARDLEVKKMAWTIMKLRKIHKARHQRLKEHKQHPSPFEKLPSDLVLKLVQHTHLRDISELSKTSAINQRIFKTNENAIFRGIEIEQFPEWKWLFGDSKHRTPAQAQHLKDAIISENYFQNPGAHGWAYDEQLLEILQMIDNNEFTGVRNVLFLQDMQDRVDMDIEATERYTMKNIARRTAMCLRRLSFRRPGIVKEENRSEDGSLVNSLMLPWEARCQLINEQPASIQTEIRSVIKLVVEVLCDRLQDEVREWIRRHYRTTIDQQKARKEKRWMSKLMTGLILQTVIPHWRVETLYSSRASCFAWESQCAYLAFDLGELWKEHDEGNVDVIQEVQNGVEFGKSIGLEVEELLEGTLVGGYFDGEAYLHLQEGADEGYDVES